jgi:gamma-glutamyltranspeptidase/glutathione hydrolase
LLHIAGISEGGLLTSADLAAISDLDVTASSHPAITNWFEAPWANEAVHSSNSLSLDSLLMVLAAVDNRGVFAGAAYEWTTNGIAIDGLELEAPACAVPVMRGITRIAPGCPIPTAAPMAIQVVLGQPVAIVCDSRIRRLDEQGISQAQHRIGRDPTTRVVTTSGYGNPAL